MDSVKKAKVISALRKATVLSTGDELVEGRTVDTNASYIAERLAGEGLDVVSILTVGDWTERIEWAWRHALEQADLVICTGGLGPTADDLTNETLARVAGVELVLDEAEAAHIRGLFARRGRRMPPNNLKQAMLPAGCEVVPNALGTAPGYRLAITVGARRPVAIGLPGVPREMKAMFEEHVLPWVRANREPERVTLSRTFQTFGMPESAIDEALDGVVPAEEGRLSLRASFPRIAVRVSVSGAAAEAATRLARLAREVMDRLGPAIYAEGDVGMEQVVGQLLREQGKTLATAESCSGGLIGSRVTDVAGSSAYYLGGLVAYSNDLKQRGLGVSAATLLRYGAVSEETAREMALGVCRMTGADLGVATTGVAGPDGGSAAKPVGTVAVALAVRAQPAPAARRGSSDTTAGAADEWTASSRTYRLWGDRGWIKILASQVALDWVRRSLIGLDPLASDFGVPDRRGKEGA